jgi:chaperonin GroEL
MGFNADEEKIEDLVQSGVIDPTKVVRVAIQNASSIAGLLLTTEALISELPEKPKGGHAGHGHEGGYPDFD